MRQIEQFEEELWCSGAVWAACWSDATATVVGTGTDAGGMYVYTYINKYIL